MYVATGDGVISNFESVKILTKFVGLVAKIIVWRQIENGR